MVAPEKNGERKTPEVLALNRSVCCSPEAILADGFQFVAANWCADAQIG